MIRIRYAFAALLVLGWAGSPGDAVAQQQNEVHEDWSVRCVERESLPPCDMVQFVTHNENGEPVMQFSVAHAGHEDHYGIQIMVPLGVRLSPGVAIRIDDGSLLDGFQFTRCEVAGCFIERLATADVLKPFQAGNAGVLAVLDRRGQPMVIPLSFKGFTRALAAMTERNRQWAYANVERAQ